MSDTEMTIMIFSQNCQNRFKIHPCQGFHGFFPRKIDNLHPPKDHKPPQIHVKLKKSYFLPYLLDEGFLGTFLQDVFPSFVPRNNMKFEKVQMYINGESEHPYKMYSEATSKVRLVLQSIFDPEEFGNLFSTM